MKTIKQISLLMLIIMILVTPISAKEKIKIEDTWIYVSSFDNKYNETVIGDFEYVKDDKVTSFVRVNTTRPHNLGYFYDYQVGNSSLLVNLTRESTELLLTKTGGIPIFSNALLTGFVEINFEGKPYIYNFTNMTPSIFYEGEPSKIFATGESEVYEIEYLIEDELAALSVYQKILLSTDNTLNDNEMKVSFSIIDFRLFTAMMIPKNNIHAAIEVTMNDDYTLNFDFEISHDANNTSMKTDNIIISNEAFTLPTYEMNWDNTNKMPNYMTQTLPVDVISGLGLNKLETQVEFFLLNDNVIIESTNVPFLTLNILISSMIIMIIIKKNY